VLTTVAIGVDLAVRQWTYGDSLTAVRMSSAPNPVVIQPGDQQSGSQRSGGQHAGGQHAGQRSGGQQAGGQQAGGQQPWLLGEYRLELVMGSGVVLLVALTGLSIWCMVSGTLRPINAIRIQFAEISGTDLSSRLSEPCHSGEIADLVHTANETLDRLERSVEQHRRFASDASHELRTPIAALRTELESALMSPQDCDLVASLTAALRGADRLETIVSDLLLLARLGTGGMVTTETIDLAEMVSTELELRPPSLLVGADLYSGAVVNGVRIQLVRVLDNLLDNAERYGDGAIDVVVGTHEGQALLMVTDRGQGIAEADRERVFERFTRLDGAPHRGRGGTGLGLSIARDIAIAHGGTLRIEDSPHGARFVLRLPHATNDSTRETTKTVRTKEAPKSARKKEARGVTKGKETKRK
jgi:signal transduction histidine kinase